MIAFEVENLELIDAQVFGRPQNGLSLPVDATTPITNCATSKGALHYYERTAGSVQS